MIVATVDNSYGANISCDVGELLLISDDPRGVTFHIQIEGKIPSKLMANAYNSKGLDLSVEGGFENNILSLTVRDVASKKDSGTFRVLMSDGDDPSHVIGEITLPVMIRF